MVKIGVIWPCWYDDVTVWYKYKESLEELQRASDGAPLHHVSLIAEPLEQGEKPTVSKFKREWERAHTEIERLAGVDLWVACGADTFKFVSEGLKLSDWAGRKIEVRGISLTGSFHPDICQSYAAKARQFHSQWKSILGIANSKEVPNIEFAVLGDNDLEDVATVFDVASAQDLVVFDYETTGLDPATGDDWPRCVGISFNENAAYVLLLEDNPETEKMWAEWVSTSDVPKLAKNAKFEYKWTVAQYGVEPRNIVEDPGLLHAALHEESSHDLAYLAAEYTDRGGYDTAMVREVSEMGYRDADINVVAEYCAGDCDAELKLHRALLRELSEHPCCKKIEWNYRNVMLPQSLWLGKVELEGMHINTDHVLTMIADYGDDIDYEEAKLNKSLSVRRAKKIAGVPQDKPFNANSRPQMQALMFDVLRMPVLAKTKTGASTKGEVLEEYAKTEPIARRILKVRSAKSDVQELGDYLERLRPDGTINSDFRLDVVVTGRVSSSKPNLQNISGSGRVKEAFWSRYDGGRIGVADFSQLELRIIGSIAREERYIESFAKGIDAHRNSAAAMFKVDLEDVSDELRTKGKRSGFGVVYGIGPKRLAAGVGRPGDERYGQYLLDAYFDAHPGVRRYMDYQHSYAAEFGYVVSKLGRVRHLPGASSSDRWERERANRQAGNFPIQNLGSDITLLSGGKVSELMEDQGLESVIIGTVHDSLYFDIYPGEEEAVHRCCVAGMEEWTADTFPFLIIPLEIDFSTGPNLKEQKPWLASE